MLNLLKFLKHKSLDFAKVPENEHQEMIYLSSDEFVLKHVGKRLEHALRRNSLASSNVLLDEHSKKLF